MMNRRRLMIPGPVDLADEVLEPMGAPVVAHYGAEWVPIHRETISLLQYAFRTQSSVFMLPGSGTTGLDACIGSLLAAGDRVLVLSNGSFGKRLVAISKAYGLEPNVLSSSSVQPSPLDQVEERLAQGGWKALLMVHHETSSGVLNPVQQVGDLCRRHDVPLIVDAVSSLGVVELDTDGWGVDLCITASQKGLEAPPGLAIVSVSERAWRIMDEKGPTRHGYCLSLPVWRETLKTMGDWHPAPVTMPCNIVLALRASLHRFVAEGWENRLARYRRAAQVVRTGLRAMGMDLLVEDRWASTGITAFKAPPGVGVSAIVDYLLEKHNIMIANGSGEWLDKALRIGHMGPGTQPDYLITLLLSLEDALRHLGCSIPVHSSLAGLSHLW